MWGAVMASAHKGTEISQDVMVADLGLGSHSAVLIQAVAQSVRDKGFDLAPLLPEGWQPEHFLGAVDAKLTFRQAASFFERAALASNDPLLGFHSGQRREFRSIGIPAYAALSAPNLAGFFAAIAEHFCLFCDNTQARFNDDGEFTLWAREPKGLPHGQYLEFLMVLLVRAARLNIQRRSEATTIQVKSVWLNSRPGTDLAARTDFWGVTPRDGAEVFGFQLEQSDLRQPLIDTDPYLHHLIEQFAALRHDNNANMGQDLAHRVENLVYHDILQAKATQGDVARQLGISPRTLSRGLSKSGRRFFQIVDQTRRTLAHSYLRDSALPLADVAETLGYASLSSFTEAFKRWSGITPGQFRDNQRLGD